MLLGAIRLALIVWPPKNKLYYTCATVVVDLLIDNTVSSLVNVSG